MSILETGHYWLTQTVDPEPGMEPFSLAFLIGGLSLSLMLLYNFSKFGRPVTRRLTDLEWGNRFVGDREAIRKILDRLNFGQTLDTNDKLVSGENEVVKSTISIPLIPKLSKDLTGEEITVSIFSSNSMPAIYETAKEIGRPAVTSRRGDVLHNLIDSKIFQIKTEATSDVLDKLKDLLKQGAEVGKGCALQLGTWGVLKQTDNQVEVLKFPTTNIPAIFHAEYAAGLLTIVGLHLEDADITISNTTKTWRLDAVRRLKLKVNQVPIHSRAYNGQNLDLEILTLPVRLNSQDDDPVVVLATEKIQVCGQSILVTSDATIINYSLWQTVLCLWIPTILLWIFVISFAMKIAKFVATSFIVTQSFAMLPFLWVILISRSLPNCIVEFAKFHLETTLGGCGRALWVFYDSFLNLRGREFGEQRKGTKVVVKCTSTSGPTAGTEKTLPVAEPKTAPPRRSSRHRHQVESNDDDENSGTNSINDPEWNWPAFDEFKEKSGNVQLRKRVEEVPSEYFSPFRVIYRIRKNQLWPDVVQVGLSSTALIKILQKYLPKDGDLQCLEKPNLKGRDLFAVLASLKNHLLMIDGDTSVGESDASKGKLHLQHLVRFLDTEYNDAAVRSRRMATEHRFAWDLLWAFLTPGKKVVYNCDHTQELLAAVVSKTAHILTQQGWALSVELEVWDYNGKSYQKCQIRREIAQFEGERPFTSLAVRPIEFEGDPEILNAGFLANGRTFYELTVRNKHRFMLYSGPLCQKRRIGSCWQLLKENADGRVMIDLNSFAKMNPGYPLGNATPPAASSRMTPFNTNPFKANYGNLEYFYSGDSVCETDPAGTVESDVSEEALIEAPAIVYGFSFTLKQWGAFNVRAFKEIYFDTNAFDALVMESKVKSLVHNLVGQYVARPVGRSQQMHIVDPISGKGEGCIFLCYGPPGTGKTLTAESVAESMSRPLWALSVSELGTTPSALETTLVKVLDIAATWRAVLLLDEADVYLEKRTSGTSLERNAMTGVFLRLLEYYRGVLFLTTNRIGTFDEAFRSRISMFLCYRELTAQQREQIWRNLLGRAEVEDVTAKMITEFASHNLNGREIRNAINTAQTWAKSTQNWPLKALHVRFVMGVLAESLDTLTVAINDSMCHETLKLV